MRLDPDGAEHVSSLFDPHQVERLCAAIAQFAGPGLRLSGSTGFGDLIAPATALAQRHLGPAARAVRATAFDKSAARNWSLGWHQDRTIAVRARRDTPGFTRWTRKSGIDHVEPPQELLARMVTIRIHLDPVGDTNAPLLVAPGSHGFGRIAEPDIAAIVARCGTRACHAAPGDAWLYRSLILHASARAERPTRRRVLQLMYSADDLPNGLEWPR